MNDASQQTEEPAAKEEEEEATVVADREPRHAPFTYAQKMTVLRRDDPIPSVRTCELV